MVWCPGLGEGKPQSDGMAGLAVSTEWKERPQVGAFGALIFICFAISDSLRCVLRGLIMQNFPGAPPPSPITKLLSKFNTFWAFNFYLFCYF